MSEGVIEANLITTSADVILLAEPVVIELEAVPANITLEQPPAAALVLEPQPAEVVVIPPAPSAVTLVQETTSLLLEPTPAEVTIAPIGTQGPPGPSVTGPQGETGPQGPMGPSGPPGDGSYFEQTFATPSTEWVLNHNLNSLGVVVITVDNADNEIEGDVDYVSPDTVIVRWYYPFAGKARVFT